MKKYFVILIAMLTMGIISACSNSDSTYKTVPLDDMSTYLDQGYQIVDVRTPEEFAAGHIPDAQNVPLSEIQNWETSMQDSNSALSSLSKDDKYLIICQSGNRSKQASDILFDHDYQIVNFSEGMSSYSGEVVTE